MEGLDKYIEEIMMETTYAGDMVDGKEAIP